VELVQPALQQAALGRIIGQRQGPGVGVGGLVGPAEPTEQLTPGRVQVPVLLQWESFHQGQAGLGTLVLGDRHRTVELDHR